MSQTVLNLAAGNAAGALWYGVSGKTSTASGTTPSFDQTLLAMLTGNITSQDSLVSNPLLTLAGLVETGDTSGLNEEEQSLALLLDNLLQQLQQLDEVLNQSDLTDEANTELLASLQAWLQNVYQLLQNNSTAGADLNQSNGAVVELPVLAQHPQTMKFAVQDALLQLITASSKQNAGNTAIDATQIKAMLESLQNVLSSAGVTGELNSSNKSAAFSEFAALLANKNGLETSGSLAQVQRQGDDTQGRLVQQKSDAIVPVTTVNSSAALLADSESFSSEAGDTDHPLQAGNIVTAGQLAMRDIGATPLKTVQTPTVPVEKFSQEMSGFLVSKFDIVKANGISEAKISLYPEHLGQVDVKITMQNGLLTAQFVTEHAFAKESLEAQMAQLRQALQSQGLQVNKLEVTQNTALSSHMYQDGRQSGNGSSQQQNGKRREVLHDDEAIMIKDLSDEWHDWVSEARSSEDSLGSSFVARA
ncbi:flagellar hook-length control protein FliK [Fontibacillus panacisegetis]|uniref:Flagellar hook-length control protein FliK n=1 Tax=Fontibacillus panacisegetis TaxID=670482 RepID=A0A1G7F1B9_9BACL|nr:flagellar hook-length control protein FliK [Fontibacillus panacisegetis]SDE69699.1 flagellar hook-length control protein FliK [Fontibacillus panacisegetis]